METIAEPSPWRCHVRHLPVTQQRQRAVALSHRPIRSWRPSGAPGELALERGRDVLNGGELVGGERLDEELADGP